MNHVFLSYRHESDDHANAVRNLGEKLKAAGFPVELDQFYLKDHPGGPDEGWRKWCEDRAEKSSCVLIVCSKGWFDSYRKEGPLGKGLGAALEAVVFSGEIYDEKGRNARVRLVNMDNFNEASIPQRLKDWHIFRLFSGVVEFDQMTKWIRQRLAMPGSSGSPPKVVFLAECAFDMQRERKKLQSFLQDQDWQVRPTSNYDLAGREAALQADLGESVAFVQLLESYARETGFDRQQREAAKLKPRFLFRDEEITLDEADAQQEVSAIFKCMLPLSSTDSGSSKSQRLSNQADCGRPWSGSSFARQIVSRSGTKCLDGSTGNRIFVRTCWKRRRNS